MENGKNGENGKIDDTDLTLKDKLWLIGVGCVLIYLMHTGIISGVPESSGISPEANPDGYFGIPDKQHIDTITEYSKTKVFVVLYGLVEAIRLVGNKRPFSLILLATLVDTLESVRGRDSLP